jgi:hypothetical protein
LSFLQFLGAYHLQIIQNKFSSIQICLSMFKTFK